MLQRNGVTTPRFGQGRVQASQGSELGLTGFTSCGKAESMGLLIRSLPDGRLALRTHATFAVAASAGPLFPDRGQTESGRRGSQAERDSAAVRLRHDRRVRQLRRHL